MDLTEQLAAGVSAASKMTLAQVEEALAEGTNCTMGELIALALVKKAAEGGMDAVKFMRDLSKTEVSAELPRVEIRVIGPDEQEDE